MRQSVNMVGVSNGDGTPLSPARPARARWLLKNGKARVVSVLPFVIQLTYEVQAPVVVAADLVIDDGETYGMALVEHRPDHDRVVVGLEGRTRGREISDNLKKRKSLRSGHRSRRNKKHGRKGEPRIHYRKGTDYPQSIRSDVEAKLNVVRDVLRYFPVTRIIIEPVKIDLVRQKRPRVKGRQYQEGPASGIEADNKHQKKRLAVLKRDGYRCLYCGDPVMEETACIHHFKARKSGGTNRYDVIGTLCARCHTSVVTENLSMVFDPGRFPDTRAAGRLMHGRYLFEAGLRALGLPVEVRYGYETKARRERMGLPKSHVNDAAALGSRDGYPLRLSPLTWRVEHRKRHPNRKLFSPNAGVVHYRTEADAQPGVDHARMKVDDHDQETSRKNRSYRRHVRNRYYKQLRQLGQFNDNLLPGRKGLNEPYAVNEAVYIGSDGHPVAFKNHRIWREQEKPLLPRWKLFEKGDIVRTKEGILSKVVSLMSNGLAKILFCSYQDGRKCQFTQRNPKDLTIVQKGKSRSWLPVKSRSSPQ